MRKNQQLLLEIALQWTVSDTHCGMNKNSPRSGYERKKLEGFCRYVSRPVVAHKRLSLTANGSVRYRQSLADGLLVRI